MIKTKALTFNSGGVAYSAGPADIFMDNGARVVYIANGKYADPTAQRIVIAPKEWARIRKLLKQIDYEKYYGRMPSVSGVSIYQVRGNQ